MPAVCPAVPSLSLQTAPSGAFPSLHWRWFEGSHLGFRFGKPSSEKADDNQLTVCARGFFPGSFRMLRNHGNMALIHRPETCNSSQDLVGRRCSKRRFIPPMLLAAHNRKCS